MSIPTNEEILIVLDHLDEAVADDLETQWLEFKPWVDPKESMRDAVETAICLANSDGGVIVFGVADRTKGRSKAIHGAKGYTLDTWRRGIYDSTRPNLPVEVSELDVAEGTGKLLIVRVPKGTNSPYGTAQGLYKIRIGKNCMPLDSQAFARRQVASGATDWSVQKTNLHLEALDPVEIARGKNILRGKNPESELLKLKDESFLTALGALQNGYVTHAGLLLFGREDVLLEMCPQHQVHYVFLSSETEVARNDSMQQGLLNILQRIEQNFSGPINPEQELSVGFFKIRIPAYPLDAVREGFLNAVTHRDYSDPGEVLLRHSARELAITSPGGFIGGITPQNILRHAPMSRNRTLAEAFEKLRLVERAGIGRRRIFMPLLSYGKRPPRYEANDTHVTLRIFDGSYDAKMATLASKWRQEGIEVDLDGLLILFYLREHASIDSTRASELLQLTRDEARGILDQLTYPPTAMLERRGRTKAATYHLSKPVASDLLGKTVYTGTKGINPLRYAEMVKEFLKDHKAISPKQCRELFHLGDSQTAKVEVSRLLRKWSGAEGFLRREGKPPKVIYYLKERA